MSDLRLERMLLGELPADELERARLDELRRDSEEILAAHPVEQVEAEIARRVHVQATLQRSRPRSLGSRLVPALAVALSSLLVLWAVQPELEETRWKGAAPHLVIHRDAGDHADRLVDGAEVHAGDVLQVSYVSLGRPYGVIFSIDGTGVVTLHHPGSTEAIPELLTGEGAVPLPTAYELDDAPRFERFFFVTSDRPLQVDTVLRAARAGELAFEGLEMSTIQLEKVAR